MNMVICFPFLTEKKKKERNIEQIRVGYGKCIKSFIEMNHDNYISKIKKL